MSKLIIATRKSPLALAQTETVAAHLATTLGVQCEQLRIVTTGDRQTEWSLEKRGGKGLFTAEIEQALLRGEADIAVHSTKDLPGEMCEGLAVAGYLPRVDARDVLVKRVGIDVPATVATGSPRRRAQLSLLHPGVTYSEIRGNVDTRLRKIASDKVADATMLAAAGLARLGISSWEGLEFVPMAVTQMVPAVGQAAIAIQCRTDDVARFASVFDAATARAVAVERAFQNALGGGCHTAFAAHAAGDTLHLFHEACGLQRFALGAEDYANPAATAARILSGLRLLP